MYFKKDEKLTANDKTIPIFRLARLPEDLIPGQEHHSWGNFSAAEQWDISLTTLRSFLPIDFITVKMTWHQSHGIQISYISDIITKFLNA